MVGGGEGKTLRKDDTSSNTLGEEINRLVNKNKITRSREDSINPQMKLKRKSGTRTKY